MWRSASRLVKGWLRRTRTPSKPSESVAPTKSKPDAASASQRRATDGLRAPTRTKVRSWPGATGDKRGERNGRPRSHDPRQTSNHANAQKRKAGRELNKQKKLQEDLERQQRVQGRKARREAGKEARRRKAVFKHNAAQQQRQRETMQRQEERKAANPPPAWLESLESGSPQQAWRPTMQVSRRVQAARRPVFLGPRRELPWAWPSPAEKELPLITDVLDGVVDVEKQVEEAQKLPAEEREESLQRLARLAFAIGSRGPRAPAGGHAPVYGINHKPYSPTPFFGSANMSPFWTRNQEQLARFAMHVALNPDSPDVDELRMMVQSCRIAHQPKLRLLLKALQEDVPALQKLDFLGEGQTVPKFFWQSFGAAAELAALHLNNTRFMLHPAYRGPREAMSVTEAASLLSHAFFGLNSPLPQKQYPDWAVMDPNMRDTWMARHLNLAGYPHSLSKLLSLAALFQDVAASWSAVDGSNTYDEVPINAKRVSMQRHDVQQLSLRTFSLNNKALCKVELVEHLPDATDLPDDNKKAHSLRLVHTESAVVGENVWDPEAPVTDETFVLSQNPLLAAVAMLTPRLRDDEALFVDQTPRFTKLQRSHEDIFFGDFVRPRKPKTAGVLDFPTVFVDVTVGPFPFYTESTSRNLLKITSALSGAARSRTTLYASDVGRLGSVGVRDFVLTWLSASASGNVRKLVYATGSSPLTQELRSILEIASRVRVSDLWRAMANGADSEAFVARLHEVAAARRERESKRRLRRS